VLCIQDVLQGSLGSELCLRNVQDASPAAMMHPLDMSTPQRGRPVTPPRFDGTAAGHASCASHAGTRTVSAGSPPARPCSANRNLMADLGLDVAAADMRMVSMHELGVHAR
jgi:hypothetical protein